jgi:hypothetical protein
LVTWRCGDDWLVGMESLLAETGEKRNSVALTGESAMMMRAVATTLQAGVLIDDGDMLLRRAVPSTARD